MVPQYLTVNACFVLGDEHFPEVLQLVKEQKLYSQALRLYSADGAHYKVHHIPHLPAQLPITNA